MKNLGKLLVGCVVSCAITNGVVNAKSPCGGSGFTIGAGFKFGKSQYELTNNKIKPANERFAEMVQKKLAPEKAQAKADQDVVNDHRTRYLRTGEVVGAGTQVGGFNPNVDDLNTIDHMTQSVDLSGNAYVGRGLATLVGITGRCGYMYPSGFLAANTASSAELDSCVKFQGALAYEDEDYCSYPNAPGGASSEIFTLHTITERSWSDYVIDKYGALLGVDHVLKLMPDGNGNKTDICNYFCSVRDAGNGQYSPIVNAPIFNPGAVLALESVGKNEIPEGSPHYIRLESIQNNTRYPVFNKILALFPNSICQRYRLGGILGVGREVSFFKNFPDAVSRGESMMIQSFNANHEAFSKSNIGQKYEKGDHWDGSIDLNLGWKQRFGDFSFYLGGILEIPVFKKEYQIKDKALADLKKTSNSDSQSNNNDKSKKNEDNKFGYTFEKKISFGASLMGYYNVTRMVSIGAGLNIWKKRGEFKYNNTADLYLVGEGSENAKLIEACGAKLDEFNADAKKAGYGDKTKKVSAWMFEPVVGINWFIKNFNVSLKVGYMFGKKFMKDNFELSGKGMTCSVNLSYTIPMF